MGDGKHVFFIVQSSRRRVAWPPCTRRDDRRAMPARLNVRSIIRGNKTCAPHSPAGQKLGLKHGYQFTAPDLHEIVPVVCAASGGAFEFVSRKAAGGAGAAVLINIANLVAQGYFDAARSDERCDFLILSFLTELFTVILPSVTTGLPSCCANAKRT